MNYLPNEYKVAICIREHNALGMPANLSALAKCFDKKISKQDIADCLRWLLDTGIIEREWVRIRNEPWMQTYRISEKDADMIWNLEMHYHHKSW